MKRVAQVVLVMASAVLASCGAGGTSPGGPSEPPPPIAGANIVAGGALSFGICNGPSGGCFYSQEYINNGEGCANSLRGKIRAYEDQTLLESSDWFVETTVALSPGESLSIEGCCFSQDTVQRRTRTVSETFWNNISCN